MNAAINDPKYVRGAVTSRRPISPELWIIRVRPDEKVTFVPGQYATIALPGPEKPLERPYSVASSPHEAELEFFLELVPGGELTPHLYEVPEGGEIHIRRSLKGRFWFDDKSGHTNHFMVATVTGVAPYMSMLRHMLANRFEGQPVVHRIAVIEAASTSLDLGYCEEFATYAQQYPWFHFVATVSRAWQDPTWRGERGRAEDIARKYLDGLGFTPADTTAYVCGNPQMIDNVKGVLQRAGFPKESIKEELYWRPEAGV